MENINVILLITFTVLLVLTVILYIIEKSKNVILTDKIKKLEYFISEKDKALTECIKFLKKI